MTITTGGVDVTQQTGGVGINLVTKSGTDRFKGSSRFYVTDEKFESQEHHRRRCARRARPPATRSRTSRTTASSWAARSRRAARGCGAASASRPSTSASSASTSRPRRARRSRPPSVALAASIEDVNGCLNTDRTLLQTTNLKARSAAVQGQQADALQQLRQEGAQRARRRRPAPDRNDHAAERRATRASASTVEHRAEPDLQVRRPVGGQRSAAARRAVRARRQQLHARLPRRRSCATCSRR